MKVFESKRPRERVIWRKEINEEWYDWSNMVVSVLTDLSL